MRGFFMEPFRKTRCRQSSSHFPLPMKRIALAILALTAAHAFAADPLKFNDLRRNPLWLPASTTLTNEIVFGDGSKLPVGQSAAIRTLDGRQVVLWWPGRDTTFTVAPESTTLLADASAHVAKFTPAQKALTPAALRTRKDLWPYTVTFREKQEFNDGTVFNVGDKLPLSEFDGRKVKLIEPTRYVAYTFDPEITDFYEASLRNLVTPSPSRLDQELASAIVSASTLKPVDLLADTATEYFAIYHAAAWCPYCAQTTPDILAWYQKLRASGDTRIRLVVISGDKSSEEFRTHAAKFGPDAFAVSYEKAPKLFVLNQTAGPRSLPHFYVVDRAGKTVIPAMSGQPQDRVRAVLSRLGSL